MLKQSAAGVSFTSAGLTCMLTRNYCDDTEIVRHDQAAACRTRPPSTGVGDAGQRERCLHITQLETRERINPTLAVLKQLAKALQVSVAELVG